MSTTKNPTADSSETTPEFKKKFMTKLVIVLIGGMFLDGYILGIVGPVSEAIKGELQISALFEGLIAAGALFGILVGSPLGGWAGDRFGRKPLFMIDIGLFAVASAMQFFVDGPVILLLVRFLMGVAIGAEYSVGWPMLSEFAPAHLRGRLLGATLIAWYSGFMLAFLFGYLLNEYTGLNWRFILGTSTFIAVALFLARLGLPESPRWLWSVNRHDEARALAARYLGADTFADVAQEDTRKGSFGMLFSRQYWRATLFVSGFWFCAVAPYFAIATFADSVLKQYGLSGGLAGVSVSPPSLWPA